MATPLMNDYTYGQILSSEEYEVVYALGTTYSLDMKALLSVPLALGLMGELSEDKLHSPHYLLEAINRSLGRFALFCNAGCIYVPETALKVYALMEQSIVQVGLSLGKQGFANFHPKLWIIRERHRETEQERLKLVVLSRNLTYSTDIDIVCEMTGRVGKTIASARVLKKHKPLRDLLDWLGHQADERVRSEVEDLMDCLDRVKEFELDDLFCDYDFFPMGINGYDGVKDCLEGSLREYRLDHAVLISPFVDEQTLKRFAPAHPAQRRTLITRHRAITPGILRMFAGEGVYAVKSILAEGYEDRAGVDVHEKVYFFSQQGYNFLYLGSANATRNGFGRNVEFLLKLQFTPYRMSYDKFRGQLITGEQECWFERVESIAPVGDSEDNAAAQERALRQAIASIEGASVELLPDGQYHIRVQCRAIGEMEGIMLRPMLARCSAECFAEEIHFAPVALDELSGLYVVEVGELRRVIIVPTEGLPTEARDTAVCRSLIDTKEKFISYLSFILAEDAEAVLSHQQSVEHRDVKPGTNASAGEGYFPIYEDLVRFAYSHPERVKDIRRIKSMVDDEVIPEGFDELYAALEEAVKAMKQR